MEMQYFGSTSDNEQVFSFTLKNRQGLEIVVLNWGGIIQSIRVPDAYGAIRDVCLGFESVRKYEQNADYIGAMVGRYANRISGGRIAINGTVYQLALNDGPNHLHGGKKGFDKYLYDYEVDGDRLILMRRSPDMEEGYPGNLDVRFCYHLTDNNELILSYDAISDADTLVNLTNHAYFNLSGEGKGSILGHVLTLYASFFSENDENCLPTGKLLSVENTPFDFREPKIIGKDIDSYDIQLSNGSGYDHNYVLDGNDRINPAAKLACAESGIVMTMSTTKPCVQFYSGNALSGAMGKSGIYSKRTGLCLEAQYRPNALYATEDNQSQLLKKNQRYNHKTIYHFDTSPNDAVMRAQAEMQVS